MDWSPLGLTENHFPKHKKYSGTLLIAGGGRCLWDDLEKIRIPEDVMCVNDIIMHFPFKVTHAYSNDWKMLPNWIAARRPRYKIDFHENIIAHSCYGERAWPWPGHGTSGLNAVYTGLALGYDEIILAGIPLDDDGHYFDPPTGKLFKKPGTKFTKECPDRDNEPRHWGHAARHIFNGRVKSLSGRTRELLEKVNGSNRS